MTRVYVRTGGTRTDEFVHEGGEVAVRTMDEIRADIAAGLINTMEWDPAAQRMAPIKGDNELSWRTMALLGQGYLEAADGTPVTVSEFDPRKRVYVLLRRNQIEAVTSSPILAIRHACDLLEIETQRVIEHSSFELFDCGGIDVKSPTDLIRISSHLIDGDLNPGGGVTNAVGQITTRMDKDGQIRLGR